MLCWKQEKIRPEMSGCKEMYSLMWSFFLIGILLNKSKTVLCTNYLYKRWVLSSNIFNFFLRKYFFEIFHSLEGRVLLLQVLQVQEGLL